MDCIAAARGAIICYWPDLVELRPSQFSLLTASKGD